MNPISLLSALLLVMVALCDVTSASFGGSGFLSRFFSSAGRFQPKAVCDWVRDPYKIKELGWPEKADLCFENGPMYDYPANDVQLALSNDPGAAKFLTYLTQCYNFQNQTYHHPWDQTLYTHDLCPVRQTLVDKVWIERPRGDRGHCFIAHPEQQRVMMAQCGDGLGNPDSQKCQLDKNNYFQGNYYCVPDGYVRRQVLVYCPWSVEVQCRPAWVRIPTGCSCKLYTCNKNSKLSLARPRSLPGSSLPLRGSLGRRA